MPTTADLATRETVCPACNAQPGEPCTQPTDTGRRKVAYHHLAREEAASAGADAIQRETVPWSESRRPLPTSADVQHDMVNRAEKLREARERLAALIEEGDVVYVVGHARSRTGLSASCSIFVPTLDDDGTNIVLGIQDVTEDVDTVLDLGGRTQYDGLNRRHIVTLNPVTAGREISDGLTDVLGYGLEWKCL